MKMPLRTWGRGAIVNTSSFTVPNGVFTQIQWATVFKDDFGTVNLVSRNTKITAPRSGWYLICSTGTWLANTEGSRAIAFAINSLTTFAITSIGATDGSTTPDINLSGVYYLNAGDYVEVYAFQNRNTGTLAITGANLQVTELKKCIGTRLEKSTISVSNNTEQIATFDTVNRDDFNNVKLNLINSKLYVPHEGWYMFFGGGDWASNGTGERYCAIKLNSSVYMSTQGQGTNNGRTNPNQYVTAAYYCKQGDYAELAQFQASGGSLNIANNYLTGIKLC